MKLKNPGHLLKHGVIGLLAVFPFLDSQADKAADRVTARRLMDPGSFPDAQFGMAVEGIDDAGFGVTTTGARFQVDTSRSRVIVHQRLGKGRECVQIHLPPDALKGVELRSHTTGAVLYESSRARLRINGDSLLMFESAPGGTVEIHPAFRPEFDSTFGNSASLRDANTPEKDLVGPGREGRLILDNYGGVGVFPIGCDLNEPEPGVASVDLPPNHVLWVPICPPRPFRWEQSFHDRPFLYGSGNRIEQTLPSDDGLKQHLDYVGNIYHLHDLVLWTEWQAHFLPTRGVEELTRVRDTVHRLGARLIVYASPQYFTRGTPNEHLATTAQTSLDESRMRAGPPWYGGENLDLFLEEIDRVINVYGMDGLYFDGLYCNSVVQTYRLMRESRRIAGDGLLWVHTTWSPPGLAMTGYCPTVDAYADYVLRGEDNPRLASDPLWQRYLISAFNISNAIGMPEHNKVPEDELQNDKFVDAILDVNGRFYYHGHLGRERIREYYWPQLTDDLKARVDRVMAERNAAVTETRFLRSTGARPRDGEAE